MLNTHGRIMKGLRKASGATINWPINCGGKTTIYYDTENGNVWTKDHIGENWTQYEKETVITVTSTTTHMTMQEIADQINNALKESRK